MRAQRVKGHEHARHGCEGTMGKGAQGCKTWAQGYKTWVWGQKTFEQGYKTFVAPLCPCLVSFCHTSKRYLNKGQKVKWCKTFLAPLCPCLVCFTPLHPSYPLHSHTLHIPWATWQNFYQLIFYMFTPLRMNSIQINTSWQCIMKPIQISTDWHILHAFIVYTKSSFCVRSSHFVFDYLKLNFLPIYMFLVSAFPPVHVNRYYFWYLTYVDKYYLSQANTLCQSGKCS